MNAAAKVFLLLGSGNAAAAILLGAFGALRGRLSTELLAVFHTGNQYHLYHALGLCLVGLLALHLPPSGWLKASGWLMLCGMLIFSGSLYALAVTGVRWLGAITPLGGMALILSWLALLTTIVRHTPAGH